MSNLNLTVDIDNNAGFCIGVVTAIKKAEESLLDNTELYCLGEIVHNDEEIKRLESNGLKFINHDKLESLHDTRILFRAHGEPPHSYLTARKNNNLIIDASCPIILRLHARIKKAYEEHEHIFLYGQVNHPEIIGLNGQINNQAVIFENIEELDISSMPKKITLFSQTTKSLETFLRIIKALRAAGIEVKVEDSICRQVSNRRENLIEFSKNYEAVVFVAGRNSSNGKVLFNICLQANPATHFISEPGEIDPGWFHDHMRVGVTGATSTPLWLMEKVKDHISGI